MSQEVIFNHDHIVEVINNKLEDLNVAGTFRFTGSDVVANIFSLEVSSTCRVLIDALRYYDVTILPISDSPTKEQILAAIAPRQSLLSSISAVFDIIDYLCSHLQAERLFSLTSKQTKAAESTPEVTSSGLVELDTGRGLMLFQLDRICKDMQIDLDLISMDESEILKMLVQRIESSVESLPDGLLQNPPTIIKGISRERLSSKQEQMLDRINTIFMKDFTVRRRMLLKRLDVTIQSFLWGASVQGKEDEILAVINAQRQHLTEVPSYYSLDDALRAPVSLMHEHTKKVTGGHTRDSSNLVKKVMIGSVPDRGGRPMTEDRAKAQIAKENRYGGGGGGGGRG